jgi:hypothetical protein
MKGVLPRLVRWALRAGTGDCFPALVALVGPIQNICFLTVHYFNSFVSITGQTVVSMDTLGPNSNRKYGC